VAGRAGQGRAGGCGGGEEARGASADASAEATVDGLSQGMRKLSVRPLSALLWRRKSRGSKAAEEPVEGQPVGPKATRGVPITIAQTVARPGAAEAGARKA